LSIGIFSFLSVFVASLLLCAFALILNCHLMNNELQTPWKRSAWKNSAGTSSCAPMPRSRNVARVNRPGFVGIFERRLKELNLVGAEPLVYRTKANCLRVCVRGPIAVVYPEGVWYHSCGSRFGTHHPGALIGGKVVGSLPCQKSAG